MFPVFKDLKSALANFAKRLICYLPNNPMIVLSVIVGFFLGFLAAVAAAVYLDLCARACWLIMIAVAFLVFIVITLKTEKKHPDEKDYQWAGMAVPEVISSRELTGAIIVSLCVIVFVFWPGRPEVFFDSIFYMARVYTRPELLSVTR